MTLLDEYMEPGELQLWKEQEANRKEMWLLKNREAQRKWRKANPEKARGASRAWHKANPEKVRKKNVRWQKANPEYSREYKLKKNYGLSVVEWDAMFEAQGRCCAVCGGDDPKSKLGWHTDHDHKTGKIRGIDCGDCNRGLGAVKDDIETLQKMIVYLQKHGV